MGRAVCSDSVKDEVEPYSKSLTTDNVRPSPKPSAWRVGDLTIAGAFMGVSELIFCTAVLAFGKFRLGFGIETLQTLAFLVIVFGNQATTYTNRTRQRLWSTRPSFWLVLSSIADLRSLLRWLARDRYGTPSFVVMGGTLAGAIVFAFVVDIVKVPIFHRLQDHLKTTIGIWRPVANSIAGAHAYAPARLESRTNGAVPAQIRQAPFYPAAPSR